MTRPSRAQSSQSRDLARPLPGDRPPADGPLPPFARRRSRPRSPWVLLAALVALSLAIGVGLAQALEPPAIARAPLAQAPAIAPDPNGTVDPVAEGDRLGRELYLAACATCHVPVPPAVLPDETWRVLIQSPDHYGIAIEPPRDPGRLLIWNYLRDASRGLVEEEREPYRLARSRYFTALHPKVEFAEPVTLRSCATCHPRAERDNYRLLSPEWDDAP